MEGAIFLTIYIAVHYNTRWNTGEVFDGFGQV